MSWIFITIISYFLLAIVSFGDKFLIDKVLPNSKVYAFLISALGGLVVLAAPWFLVWPGWFLFFINIMAGVFFTIALIFMFEALRRGDASRVTVLIGGIIPVFTIFFSYLLLAERFTNNQIIGVSFLILGTFLIAFFLKNRSGKINNRKMIYFILLSSFFYALFFISTKYAYSNQDFFSSFIWIRVGSLLAAILLIIRKKDRLAIFQGISGSKQRPTSVKNKIFIFGNQGIGAVGSVLQSYAISFGSVAIINALQGVQYVFLLIFGWVVTIFFPNILKEDISKKIIIGKIVSIFLISLGLYFITI